MSVPNLLTFSCEKHVTSTIGNSSFELSPNLGNVRSAKVVLLTTQSLDRCTCCRRFSNGSRHRSSYESAIGLSKKESSYSAARMRGGDWQPGDTKI